MKIKREWVVLPDGRVVPAEEDPHVRTPAKPTTAEKKARGEY